jgi:hypothetical protein
VSAISDWQSDQERTAAVQRAAEDLNVRLKNLAGTLSGRQRPERVRYGRGRIGNAFKRLSPEGFVLDPVNLQMLLPDGRLWTYSRSDSTRFPMGRSYDASIDYTQFAGNRTFPGGREFVFLGAVLGKYTFGLAAGDHAHGPAQLCAICGEGRSVRYVTADEAFAAITESAPAPSSSLAR